MYQHALQLKPDYPDAYFNLGNTLQIMGELDLALEMEAVVRLNEGIALAVSKLDNGTRELLESILKEEEESIDWHEAQLHQIKEIGRERYLAQQIFE